MMPLEPDRIDRFCDVAGETLRTAAYFLARLIVCVALIGLCAIPFIMIEDKSKVSFWYCTGAFGVYLFGVAHLLSRKL